MKAYPKKTRFVVWGFGVTGRALADVLSARGYPVTVIEDRPESSHEEHSEDIARMKKSGVKFRFGGVQNLTGFITKEADVLAPSPGIKVPEDMIRTCEKSRIQIAGEVEIASRIVPGQKIAVTGTDGKTTVATLIHHILKSSGIKAHLAGNIGTPFISLAGKTKSDHWLVIEISSYQLETTRLFYPQIAVLLNIAEDHLERHGDMRTYIRTKGRIFDRQRDQDHAIINFDDPLCIQAYGMACSKIHGFSLAGPVPEGAWRENGSLMVDTEVGRVKVLDTSELKLIGEHNQSNALASALAAYLAGCPIDEIRKAIMNFEGLPHRIEQVADINGVRWINDSKATNVHSTISAIECFSEPIILMLGGFDKGLDITDLIPYISRQVRHVILFGETRNRFRKDLRDVGYTNITIRKTLQEACSTANNISESGDIVLLSPASSSFDQFKNFMERGDTFRKWVRRKLERKTT